MLISLNQLIAKYNMHITGIIHVGAHYGEEYPEYAINGIRDVIFIEPCSKAFTVLRQKYAAHHHIQLYNFACGAKDGVAKMNVETANNGQSNSLLKPNFHLQQYPEIKFTETEEVPVLPLDSLLVAPKYNMLCMDVQGYEGEVLKGATKTLKNIKYVYTEVNFAEMYSGCVRVEQLDEMLHEFTRVETDSSPKYWGDALYIRKT